MAGGVANSDQFESYFKRADLDQDGRVSGSETVSFFQASGLPKPVLAKIWTIADQNGTGFLGRQEFYNYIKLVTVAQSRRDLTPDIVRAALYGPASAKIPAPQINLGTLPAPQSNLPAGPPPPQMGSNPSTRGSQGYPPQQSQTMRPPQSALPTTTFQSPHGGMMLAPSGSSLSAPPRPQGPTNLLQNAAPKTNGITSSASGSSVAGNGFVSNTAFGGTFTAPPSQAKNNSAVTVSPSNIPASGGTQLPNKPSQLFQGNVAHQPTGNQNHQMQPTFRPNQQVPVQISSTFSSQPSQPWPKLSQSSVQKYTKVFMEVDTDRDGKISGDQARNLFLSWKLPREILMQVWDLSDQDDDSMLSLKEFCIALYLMERFREGRPLPKVLPSTIFEGSTLPPSGQPQPPVATYGAPSWRPPPGVHQAHGMAGPHQVTPGAPRPPRPVPVPVHEPDEDMQPRQRKPTVPVLEKHLVDQLSTEELSSLSSKFQEATEADKKVVELEIDICEAKQKIEFYRNKMQEIVLYKSRCDSRLNEITERVSTDKREARADRIQADLVEQVKALNERCKMYGLRGKPTSLVELPFGWQPGFQEGAADWDESWDKFEDEELINQMSEYIGSFSIQYEIMKRLPVESLLCCRCVSKAWKSLIDDTGFIIAHSHHRHTHPRHLLVSNPADDCFRFLSYINDDTFPQQLSVPTVPSSVKRLLSVLVIGSSHGLVCVRGYDPSDDKHVAVLWNPSIRKSVAVPVPDPFTPYFGFGVCPVTGDPKLLSITDLFGKKAATVYSLRSNIWTPKTMPDGDWSRTITTKRFIYSRPIDKKIVSFHLTRETFEAIDLPNNLASRQLGGDFCYSLKLRESLVLIRSIGHDFGTSHVVWMLRDDGVQRSFTKLYEIETPSRNARVLEFRNDGMPIMVLAKDDDDEPPSLVVMEPNSDCTDVIVTPIKIDGLTNGVDVHSYTKTLLLLCCKSD